LAATKQLNAENLGDWLIAGELSLSGATRPVRGALAMARLARSLGKRGLLLPGISAEEAAMVVGVAVYRVDSLDRAVRFLSGEISLTPLDPVAVPRGQLPSSADRDNAGFADFSEIKGQHTLRRAVEVAVSGFHNLLMLSDISPGTALRGTRQTDRTTCFRIPVMKSGV
jgi:magnesium chelatase family protein